MVRVYAFCGIVAVVLQLGTYPLLALGLTVGSALGAIAVNATTKARKGPQ